MEPPIIINSLTSGPKIPSRINRSQPFLIKAITKLIAQCDREFRPRATTSFQPSNTEKFIKTVDQLAHALTEGFLAIHRHIL